MVRCLHNQIILLWCNTSTINMLYTIAKTLNYVTSVHKIASVTGIWHVAFHTKQVTIIAATVDWDLNWYNTKIIRKNTQNVTELIMC